MKIQTKLQLLVLGTLAMGGVCVGVSALLLAPVTRIGQERQILNTLSLEVAGFRSQVNRLLWTHVELQKPVLAASLEQYSKAYADLQGAKLLREIDPRLAEAVKAMENLQGLSQQGIDRLVKGYDHLDQDLADAYIFSTRKSLLSFYQLPPLPDRKAAHTAALNDLQGFLGEVSDLDLNLESAVGVIRDQTAVIDGLIRQIEGQALATILALVTVLLLGTVATAAIFASRITKNIQAMAAGVRTLGQGDLSARFPVRSRDELKELSDTLTAFTARLDDTIRGIQAASLQNAESRQKLVAETAELVTSTKNAGTAMGQLHGQAQQLTTQVQESRAATAHILDSVEKLDAQILEQSTMVEESASSITEMMASITQIQRLSEKDKDLTHQLVQESEGAKEVFEGLLVQIEAILGSAGRISELLSLIDGVASQTNLLSMNAAIEAAHAGETGRGFSVVAEEIGKLAAATQSQSHEISASVKAIFEAIEAAREGSGAAFQSFQRIAERIGEVNRSVTEIQGSLTESSSGGQQILAAVAALNDISASVGTESRTMASQAGAIRSALDNLAALSGDQQVSLGAIAGLVTSLDGTVSRTSALADTMEEVGAVLESRISGFQTSGAQERENENSLT